MGVIRSMFGGLKRGFSGEGAALANKKVKFEGLDAEVEKEEEEGEVENEEEAEADQKNPYDLWMDHDFGEDKLDCPMTCAATQGELLKQQALLVVGPIEGLTKRKNINSWTTEDTDKFAENLVRLAYMIGNYASQEKAGSLAQDNLNGFAYDRFIL